MKIAVASGKGGAGKTTVATNLAYTLSKKGLNVTYVDCDVEEPNGHLFLKPVIHSGSPAGIYVPSVDSTRCRLCGLCSQICQYSAIVCLGQQILTFPEMCHSCGGCWLVCPSDAIRRQFRRLGYVEHGMADNLYFSKGTLDIGEARCTPVLKELKKQVSATDITIFDAPPGTTCPVIETISNTEFVVLVTEPTPFGLHDLILAIEMTNRLNIPMGVIINKMDGNFKDVHDYCNRQLIPILAEIVEDRAIAEAYSRGELLVHTFPSFSILFSKIFDRIVYELDAFKACSI